jgi:hypothetical protein
MPEQRSTTGVILLFVFALAASFFLFRLQNSVSNISFDTLEQIAGKGSRIDLRPFWERLEMPPGVFDSAYALWNASSTFADLDGDETPERILRITDSDDFCRFLFLKQDAAGRRWRIIGHVDTVFSAVPESRIVSNGRGRWLAINHMDAMWTPETFLEKETWYAVADSGITEVLSFASAGRTGDQYFEAGVTVRPFDGFRDRVDIRYGPPVVTLSFAKEAGQAAFRLDQFSTEDAELVISDLFRTANQTDAGNQGR